MSSPVKIPFAELIVFSRGGTQAVYIQIAHQLGNLIQRGVLSSGTELPGSRSLAALLGVHRKTIIAVYEELNAQGWVHILPNKGVFVTRNFPDIHTAITKENVAKYPRVTGFPFHHNRLLDSTHGETTAHLAFTDGLPDIRLAPLKPLAKIYGGILKRKTNLHYFGYTDSEGNEYYRYRLATFLNETRGLRIDKDNIITTRGMDMAIYLLACTLLQKGDKVIVGELGNYRRNMVFQQAGAQLLTVPVDENGISVEAIAEYCRNEPVRMVYLNPHHHYPTTVTLDAMRRIALLKLSQQYNFILLEDDDDYDFPYQGNPHLPLASADIYGQVVYAGSFDRALAPGFRAGFIVAPTDLVREINKLRRIIDLQGDLLMEQAFAEMLQEGEIQRHLKKAQKIYLERRNHFCELLDKGLGEKIRFQVPSGGLALWLHLQWGKNLLRISQDCNKKGLALPPVLLYQTGKWTAMRLGFAHFNITEMEEAVGILVDAVNG